MQKLKGLYALCDYQTLQKKQHTLLDFLGLLKKHKTFFIQYRDKSSSLEIQKNNIKFLTEHTNIPIIINDHLELLEYAGGLHLGQEDIISLQNKLQLQSAIEVIKWIRINYPNKILGISTHNNQEIEIANRLDLDYIGLGAYRATNTKDVDNILGDKIIDIAARSKHPVAAIGGVRCEDIIENITYNVVGSGLYDS